MPISEIIVHSLLALLVILHAIRHFQAWTRQEEARRREEESAMALAEAHENADQAREALVAFEPRSATELESEAGAVLAMHAGSSSDRVDKVLDTIYVLTLRHLRRWPELRSFAFDIGLARAQYRRGGLIAPEDRQAVAADLAQYA